MSSATSLRPPGFEERVFSSNVVLSDADEQLLRRIRATLQQDLSSIEAELNQQQEIMDHIKKRCWLKMVEIQRNHAGIAYRKVPPEILSQIFIEASRPRGMVRLQEEECVAGVKNMRCQWNLGQVCFSWRAISFATPELWKRIEILDLKSSLPFVQDILANRGGRVTLEIVVDPSESTVYFTPFVNLVEKYSHRIQGIDLSLHRWHVSPALATSQTVVERVRSLSLRFGRRGHLQPGLLPPLFSACPALTAVSLELIFRNDESESFFEDVKNILPWGSLTDLAIKGVFTSSSLKVLLLCQKLVNLDLNLEHYIPTPSTAVTLIHLLSLVISKNTGFLTALTTPSLKKLMIYNTETQNFDDFPNILGLLTRSGCHLEVFRSRRNPPIKPRELVAMLEAMPALRVWDARTAPIPTPILSMIVSERLAPQLSSIKGWGSESLMPLIDFLDARWTFTAPDKYIGVRDLYFVVQTCLPEAVFNTYKLAKLRLEKQGRSMWCGDGSEASWYKPFLKTDC